MVLRQHREVLTYEALHSLGRKSPTSILATHLGFCQRHAEISSASCRIALEVADVDREQMAAKLWSMRRRHGLFANKLFAGRKEDRAIYRYSWRWRPADFVDSVRLLEEREEFSSGVSVLLFARIRFKDASSGQTLPGQDDPPVIDVRRGRGSSLYLTLRPRSSLSIWFLFPELEAADLARWLEQLESDLPVRWSKNGFRRYRLGPSGQWIPRRWDPFH